MALSTDISLLFILVFINYLISVIISLSIKWVIVDVERVMWSTNSCEKKKDRDIKKTIKLKAFFTKLKSKIGVRIVYNY